MFYGECVNCGHSQQYDAVPRDKCSVVGCCVSCDTCEAKKQAQSLELCNSCGFITRNNYFVGLKTYVGLCYSCGSIADYREKERQTTHLRNELKNVKSAKAKSVVDLAVNSSSVNHPYQTQKEVIVYPIIDDTRTRKFIDKLHSEGKRVFARPAPLNPVHGFFDSRVIADFHELKKLAYEIWTKKTKEEILEVILMAEVDAAEFSGIVTPNSVTIGRGNDGATNGKTAITIRTPKSIVQNIVDKDICDKFTKENESTFIEIVLGGEKGISPEVVQVRSGNEPATGGNDFIPYDVTVSRIHNVTDQTDLVEWQKLVSTFTQGDVIHAESLACHGAVHGVLHNIPVITTFVPEIGQELKKGEITPIDFERVANLLCNLFSKEEKFKPELALYGWKMLHVVASNMQAGGEETITFALFYTLLGGIAACMGEYGHARGEIRKGFERVGANSRERIFERVFHNKQEALRYLFIAWQTFLDQTRWTSKSYGGPNWANCTEYTARLAHRIGKFIKSPSEESLKSAVSVANELAHCMHNGGLLFTKFGDCSSEDISDIFARKPILKTLLEMRELQLDTNTREQFTLLKTLLRRPPARLVNHEKVKKAEEKKKKEQNLEKTEIALQYALENGGIKITPYFETNWRTGMDEIQPGYAYVNFTLEGKSITSAELFTVIEENPAIKDSPAMVALPKEGIVLDNSTGSILEVYYDGAYDDYAKAELKVNYEDKQFKVKLFLLVTRIVTKIYDVYCKDTSTQKEINNK